MKVSQIPMEESSADLVPLKARLHQVLGEALALLYQIGLQLLGQRWRQDEFRVAKGRLLG